MPSEGVLELFTHSSQTEVIVGGDRILIWERTVRGEEKVCVCFDL